MTLGRIVILGVAIRAAALALYFAQSSFVETPWEYQAIASNLLAGRGLTYSYYGSVYQTSIVPVFPTLLAALHWVWGPGLGLFYAFNMFCAAALIALTYHLARALLRERPALWAGLFVALDPGFIVHQSYKVDVATLAAILILSSVIGFLISRNRSSLAWAFSAGAIAGIGVLTRPDVLAVLSFPIAWGAVQRKWRQMVPAAALFAAGISLCILPWLARNYQLYGRVMMTSASPMLLWAGNNPRSTGTLWTQDGIPMLKALPPELARSVNGAGELTNHDQFRGAALDYIRSKPLSALGRWSRNFLYFFSFAPDYSKKKYYPWVPTVFFYGYRMFFLCVTLAALWGSRLAWKASSRDVLALWAVPVGIALIHSLHYVEGRHRLLALPFLYILAANAFPGRLGHQGESAPSKKVPQP